MGRQLPRGFESLSLRHHLGVRAKKLHLGSLVRLLVLVRPSPQEWGRYRKAFACIPKGRPSEDAAEGGKERCESG